MGKKLELVGERFGRLVVVEEVGRSKGGQVLWKCRCDCGNESIVRTDGLRSGHTVSCGCFNRDRVVSACTKHGLYKHPLYRTWQDMLQRCGVKGGASEKSRRNYIKRGISVCEEWKQFLSFYVWALNSGYKKGLELDRIDNDGNYTPDNCHFVTRRQNQCNRRCTLRLPDGTSLAEFCYDIGIETCENGKTAPVYKHICDAYVQRNKIHPELFNALEKDLEKQERLLSQARSIRKEWEAILDELKERFKSLPTLSNQ